MAGLTGLWRSLSANSQRRLAAIGIGLLAGFTTAAVQGADNGFIDIWLAHGSAGEWLAGRDPYGYSTDGWPSNPLTAISLMVPFAPLPLRIAAPLFLGASAMLMAYGLTAERAWWRLWAFASFPFVFSMIVVQLTPLLFAVMLLPMLYPLALVKPHIGAAPLLFNVSWRRACLAAILLGATFLLLPDWPRRWVSQLAGYDGFLPFLIIPGPLLLFALPHWRKAQARFLLLYSFLPQRLWYDQLLLWWIPRTRRSMILLTVCSWGIGLVYLIYRFGWIAPELRPASREAVVWTMYLPALVALVLDRIALKEIHPFDDDEQSSTDVTGT